MLAKGGGKSFFCGREKPKKKGVRSDPVWGRRKGGEGGVPASFRKEERILSAKSRYLGGRVEAAGKGKKGKKGFVSQEKKK